MASDAEFVEFVTEQMREAGRITSRKMFGEYAVYCDEKVVALICDNRLFVKPTGRGRAYIGEVVEAPPYPGAKLYFLIEDRCDDRKWLSSLIRITARELPIAEPRKSARRRAPPGPLRRVPRGT